MASSARKKRKMNEQLARWKIENEDKVSFSLDEHHNLYIERIPGGFTIKVYDMRGYDYRPEDPVLLYSGRLSDTQLGHIGVLNER